MISCRVIQYRFAHKYSRVFICMGNINVMDKISQSVHIVAYASEIVRLCVINLVRLTNLDSK